MTEKITFASFGIVHTLDVVGTCEATGSPLVVLLGNLTAVSPIQVETAKVLTARNELDDLRARTRGNGLDLGRFVV